MDRASEYGDMLTIDVKSVLAAEAGDEEGDETVVLEEEDWDVTLDEENPMEPAGLDEELLGMSPGEEKDFELSWPEDSQSMYAGKRAKFHVKLHKIQANLEPELDDEFAKSVDEEMETLEDLRKDIRETLLERKKAQAENDYLEAVLDKLVEQAELDYPPVVVEDQIDSMVQSSRGNCACTASKIWACSYSRLGSPWRNTATRCVSKRKSRRDAIWSSPKSTRKKVSRFQTRRSRSASAEMREGLGGEDADGRAEADGRDAGGEHAQRAWPARPGEPDHPGEIAGAAAGHRTRRGVAGAGRAGACGRERRERRRRQRRFRGRDDRSRG